MTTTETHDTYEARVNRIMAAYTRREITLDDVARLMAEARKLPSRCDDARVEYEWRKRHAKKEGTSDAG